MTPLAVGLLTGSAIALGGVLVVVAIALAGWILAGDRSSLDAMFSFAGYAWLAVNGVPIEALGAIVWFLPWGLTLGLMAVTFLATASVVRRSAISGGARIGQFLAGAVGAYAFGALAVAAVSAAAQAGAPLLLAPICAAAIIVLPSLAGALSGSGSLSPLTAIPGYLWRDLRAAAIGLAVLLVAGSAAVVISLVVSFDTLRAMLAHLHPGLSGSAGLLLLSLAYLPDAAMWGASYLLGAGFSVGSGSTAAIWSQPVGGLPAFPLAAAIPTTSSWWFLAWCLAPLAAGTVAARACAGRPPLRTLSGIGARLRVAGIAGLAAGILAALVRGSLGGRLDALGPNPFVVAGLTLAWFVLGALVWDAVTAAGKFFGRKASQDSPGAVEEPRQAQDTPVGQHVSD